MMESFSMKPGELNNHQQFYNTKEQKLGQSTIEKSRKTLISKLCMSSIDNGSDIINFKNLDKQIKEKTEGEIPFTNQIIEDAIFVNNNTLLAIEYIYFQNDKLSKYH